MVMNKKEQAELDSLRFQLLEAKALRYSGISAPIKLGAPKEYTDYVNGWDYNSYNSRIYEAWTSGGSHGEGHRDKKTDKNKYIGGSQNSCNLFATKLDALIGLRLAKEKEFAKALAEIDKQIEFERNH